MCKLTNFSLATINCGNTLSRQPEDCFKLLLGLKGLRDNINKNRFLDADESFPALHVWNYGLWLLQL